MKFIVVDGGVLRGIWFQSEADLDAVRNAPEVRAMPSGRFEYELPGETIGFRLRVATPEEWGWLVLKSKVETSEDGRLTRGAINPEPADGQARRTNTMGEQKRREEQKTPLERAADELARKLANDGKLIEGGWIALRAAWLHPDTPEDQAKMMRWAFLAGAQHLFASIMTIMDPGREPTSADMAKMDAINAELTTFYNEVIAAGLPVAGTA